jgi:penicillin G amidase
LLSAVGAVVTSAVLLGVLAVGYGPIPALGSALDPGHGAWMSMDGGTAVSSESLRVSGLAKPVAVSFTKDGLASIDANNMDDLFLAMGYVEAKFRLSQMDLERRLGEGQLAALAGQSDVASDEFELRLGLQRTAENEWERTTGEAREALLAYAQGVNDDIAQVRADGDWPALFSLAGVYPAKWTPVDSLVVQAVLTQQLNYTAEPLNYELLEHSLGTTRTMDWFPIEQANPWTPYDTGPYAKEALTPVAPGFASSVPDEPVPSTAASAQQGIGGPANSVTGAAAQLLQELSQFPAQQIHEFPDSNAWAANGPAVKGGGALLGGDPHLPETLPSVWYEVSLSAPGYDVAGTSLPGVPGILLGHNAHIAWSLTDTQNQSTLYYAEQVRGDEYFWRGKWRKMTVVHYTIPVRGGATVHLAVDITMDGPIMTQFGQTMAVEWMGNVPSDDLTALLKINQATNFSQFKSALSVWRAPTQNFVYADTAGNIGAISAGYYPEVSPSCEPWLPMTGTGACDVTGVIPRNAIPQVYDPPSHLIVTANQRPVTAAYPYYIGTSNDFFDPGYRAAYAYRTLSADEPLSSASIAALQNSVTDSLATALVPKLLAALRSSALDPTERSVAAELNSWNDSMDTGSAAATVWSAFLEDYVSDVFSPWWKAAKVPTSKDPSGLDPSADLTPLDEDLQDWTLADPDNAAFRGPHGNGFSDASTTMVAAFKKAVSGLSSSLGGSPSSWTWGRVHSREIPSVTGTPGLGYGPYASGGDPFVEDAADGDATSSAGPSWRMVVSLSHNNMSAEGIYPGGQSENPASPWYDNLVALWRDDKYLPIPAPGSVGGVAKWTLDG